MTSALRPQHSLVLTACAKVDWVPSASAWAGALRAQGKPFVSVEFSEQNHGFFCDARHDYDADAAAQSWALTREFLQRHLG